MVIRRVNPVSAGKIGGVVGVVLGLILPIFYGVFCFIGGIIQAFIYNLAAKWVGGVEIEAA